MYGRPLWIQTIFWFTPYPDKLMHKAWRGFPQANKLNLDKAVLGRKRP